MCNSLLYIKRITFCMYFENMFLEFAFGIFISYKHV